LARIRQPTTKNYEKVQPGATMPAGDTHSYRKPFSADFPVRLFEREEPPATFRAVQIVKLDKRTSEIHEWLWNCDDVKEGRKIRSRKMGSSPPGFDVPAGENPSAPNFSVFLLWLIRAIRGFPFSALPQTDNLRGVKRFRRPIVRIGTNVVGMRLRVGG
jgi:hypothetical protein